MPWVRFVADFDFHVRRTVNITYHAGHEYLVTTRCACEAIAQDKAVAIERPPKADSKTNA